MSEQLFERDVQLLLVETLLEHLEGLPNALAGTHVYGVKPSDMGTAPFVLIVPTGGLGRHDRILSTAQITVDAYAQTPWLSFELSRRVSAAIHSLPALPGPVSQVRSMSPSDFPDSDSDLSRTTCTYQITTRLTPGETLG